MTTSQHKAETLAAIGNTRDVIAQASAEGAALRGEFGVQRQLVAMSAEYHRLRATGRVEEAAAVKVAAYRIYEASRG